MKLIAAIRSRMKLAVEHDGMTLRFSPRVYCRREVTGCIDYWLRPRSA